MTIRRQGLDLSVYNAEESVVFLFSRLTYR